MARVSASHHGVGGAELIGFDKDIQHQNFREEAMPPHNEMLDLKHRQAWH